MLEHLPENKRGVVINESLEYRANMIVKVAEKM